MSSQSETYDVKSLSLSGHYFAVSYSDKIRIYNNTGASNLPIVISSAHSERLYNPPKLSWFASSRNDSSLRFDFYIGDRADNLTLSAANLTAHNHTVSGLTVGSKYYWKVVARDSYGTSSSIIRHFDVNAPPTITLVSTNLIKKWRIQNWRGHHNNGNYRSYICF